MTKTKQTIVINGRLYDAATGIAVIRAEKQPEASLQPAAPKGHAPSRKTAKPSIISDISAPKARPVTVKTARKPGPHAKRKLQKSITLRRGALKKPVSPRRPVAAKTRPNIERSRHISRFATPKIAPEPAVKPAASADPELAAQAQALQSAHAARTKRQAEAHHKPAISSRAVKEHLIKQQLAKAPDVSHSEIFQAGRLSSRARFASVATTSLALVLLGGYLTYINIPNLSIRVAAANAGIDAHLPRYQPSGYRIHGPITYTDGQVSVNYQQNGGTQAYTVLQKASDWDPAAALDNYVIPESDNDYQIHSSQGLTVYTYGNKAVWVNGGILHVIDGNAPLSGQQVERIAVSM